MLHQALAPADLPRRSYLVYADDDCQEDFLDWVQEEGCMPSTEETRVVRIATASAKLRKRFAASAPSRRRG